jgi:hypothetical protein
MIYHLSYVVCDRCGHPAQPGDDAKEARVIAHNEGYDHRPWNSRWKDLCGPCQTLRKERA